MTELLPSITQLFQTPLDDITPSSTVTELFGRSDEPAPQYANRKERRAALAKLNSKRSKQTGGWQSLHALFDELNGYLYQNAVMLKETTNEANSRQIMTPAIDRQIVQAAKDIQRFSDLGNVAIEPFRHKHGKIQDAHFSEAGVAANQIMQLISDYTKISAPAFENIVTELHHSALAKETAEQSTVGATE